MKTINLTRKFAVFLAALILASVALGSVVTQMYFPQIGTIKGQGPEDPLEAWSEASYVIWQYNSTFYACRNMSTLMVETLSSNKTYVQAQTIGNLTSAGGTIYLKQITFDTTLTSVLGGTTRIDQDYQGKLTYFTSTGSVSPTDCPIATSNTFTLTSDTSEHTIVTLTPTSVEQVTNFYLDMSALTQNCTLRVYITIGAGYVEMTSMTLTVASGTKGLALKDMVVNTNWKLTIQSVTAEGASRSIPYEYFVNVY